MSEGRCMKCKKQVEIKDAKKVKSKKGKEYIRGVCPKCGTTVCTFKLD
ncbi:hypothetical protein KAT80_01665 [Candidatus Pacearchaeota archaeon]|nr:hypothetical protein [Candidatus Pacearchaeota archaeon]